MPSRTDRNDFGPPSDAGRLRSFGLALLVHGLLIGALTWGVNWKRSDTSPSFSAELWSSTVQQAAPPLAAAPPPPPPPPPPKTVQVAPPPPAAPVAKDVDIALEQEKKRKLAQQKQAREDEAAQDKRQAAADAKAEKDQQLKQEKLQAQALAKQQAASDAKKQDAANADAKSKAAAAALDEQRKQNLARAMGMAGATGDESSSGTAKVSSGPTSGYGGKVRAKVKPNIVFTEAVDGNPKAEVEVRSALDGTITSQRLIKSSGNKAWDDAVIKAIVRTESMPRDTDGRVPPVMILEFRVRD